MLTRRAALQRGERLFASCAHCGRQLKVRPLLHGGPSFCHRTRECNTARMRWYLHHAPNLVLLQRKRQNVRRPRVSFEQTLQGRIRAQEQRRGVFAALIAETLRLRAEGFSERDIAKRMGVGRSTVNGWLTGKRRAELTVG